MQIYNVLKKPKGLTKIPDAGLTRNLKFYYKWDLNPENNSAFPKLDFENSQ